MEDHLYVPPFVNRHRLSLVVKKYFNENLGQPQRHPLFTRDKESPGTLCSGSS